MMSNDDPLGGYCYLTIKIMVDSYYFFVLSQVVRRTFHFLPSLEHNGMTIRYEVRNSVTLPPGHNMVLSQTIHVVPGKRMLL